MRQETGVVRHETRYRREMRQETTGDGDRVQRKGDRREDWRQGTGETADSRGESQEIVDKRRQT